jgi:hypothetical protein
MRYSTFLLSAMLGACVNQGSPSATASTSPFSPATSSSELPAGPPPGTTTVAVPSATVVIGNSKSYKEDPTKGPSSCADVGDHVGYASCCQGQYCAGWCKPDGSCDCGGTTGCLWPEVCGSGGCVGPQVATVIVGEPPSMGVGYWALTWEPVSVSSVHSKNEKITVFDEGNTCGLDEPKTSQEVILKHFDQRRWTCCHGQRCPGYCVTTLSNPTPHCECAGVPGGCVSPHLCCGQGVTTSLCKDEPQCPHTPPGPFGK